MRQRIVYEPEPGDLVEVEQILFLDGTIKVPAGSGVVIHEPSDVSVSKRYCIEIADRFYWLLPTEFKVVTP